MSETTLAHDRGESTPALLTRTIDADLQASIARVPDRDALIDLAQGVRLTYAEFGAEVDAVARALIASGYAVGERVGIWAPTGRSGRSCSMRRLALA